MLGAGCWVLGAGCWVLIVECLVEVAGYAVVSNSLFVVFLNTKSLTNGREEWVL